MISTDRVSPRFTGKNAEKLVGEYRQAAEFEMYKSRSPVPSPIVVPSTVQLANTTLERSRFLGKDSKKGTTNMFNFFSFMFWDLSHLVVPSSHSLHIPCTWERSHFLCSMGWITSAVLPTTNTMEHSIGIDLSNPARRLNYSLPNFASIYKTSSLSIAI